MAAAIPANAAAAEAAPAALIPLEPNPAEDNERLAGFIGGLNAQTIRNKWMFVFDSGKDAGDTPGILSNQNLVHRRNMRAGVESAFPRNVDEEDVGIPQNEPGTRIPWIGDTKPFMMQWLNERFIRPAEQRKQTLMRLKFSSSKNDANVLTGLTIAHDAGLGPSGLFGDRYRLIITPGSILDPATKIRARPVDNTDYIQLTHTLPASVLSAIGLDTALPGPIEFVYIPGPPSMYRFTITMMNVNPAQAPLQITVDFNEQFQAQAPTGVYFAGNPTKNAYIAAANSNDLAQLQEIVNYLVIKDIGDALQVIWLLYITQMIRALKENYAVMSCDKVVWLRCLVNNFPMILVSGNTGTYYGSMDEDAFNRKIREGLREDVLAKNSQVIDTLRLLLLSNNATLNGTDIPAAPVPPRAPPTPRRQGFGDLVDRLVASLTRINDAIRAYLTNPDPALTLDGFRHAVKKLSMVCPVTRKGSAFKLNPEYKASFLPNNIANNDGPSILIPGVLVDATATLPFAKIHLYSAISRTINVGIVDNMCIGLRPPVQVGGVYPDDWIPADNEDEEDGVFAAPPTNGPNPLPYNLSNWVYIQDLLGNAANRRKPGFIAYMLVTYFPEILHIGYIHALDAAGRRTVDMTKLVSVNSIVEALTDNFTSLDATGTFTTEVTSPNLLAQFTLLDTAARQLATYALPVIRYIFSDPINPADAAARAVAYTAAAEASTPIIPPAAAAAAAVISNQYIYVCEQIAGIPLPPGVAAPAPAPAVAPQAYGEIYGIYDSIYNNMLMASYTNGYVPGYNPHLEIYNVPLRALHAETVATTAAVNTVINDLITTITGPNPSFAAIAAASDVVGGPITADELRVIGELGVNNARFNASADEERERTGAVMQQARELAEALAAEAAAALAAPAGAGGAGPAFVFAAPYGGVGAGGGGAPVPAMLPLPGFYQPLGPGNLVTHAGAGGGGGGPRGRPLQRRSNAAAQHRKVSPGPGGAVLERAGIPETTANTARFQEQDKRARAAAAAGGGGRSGGATAPRRQSITMTMANLLAPDAAAGGGAASGRSGGAAAPRRKSMTMANLLAGQHAAQAATTGSHLVAGRDTYTQLAPLIGSFGGAGGGAAFGARGSGGYTLGTGNVMRRNSGTTAFRARQVPSRGAGAAGGGAAAAAAGRTIGMGSGTRKRGRGNSNVEEVSSNSNVEEVSSNSNSNSNVEEVKPTPNRTYMNSAAKKAAIAPAISAEITGAIAGTGAMAPMHDWSNSAGSGGGAAGGAAGNMSSSNPNTNSEQGGGARRTRRRTNRRRRTRKANTAAAARRRRTIRRSK